MPSALCSLVKTRVGASCTLVGLTELKVEPQMSFLVGHDSTKKASLRVKSAAAFKLNAKFGNLGS